jgi:hypothetical protein
MRVNITLDARHARVVVTTLCILIAGVGILFVREWEKSARAVAAASKTLGANERELQASTAQRERNLVAFQTTATCAELITAVEHARTPLNRHAILDSKYLTDRCFCGCDNEVASRNGDAVLAALVRKAQTSTTVDSKWYAYVWSEIVIDRHPTCPPRTAELVRANEKVVAMIRARITVPESPDLSHVYVLARMGDLLADGMLRGAAKSEADRLKTSRSVKYWEARLLANVAKAFD